MEQSKNSRVMTLIDKIYITIDINEHDKKEDAKKYLHAFLTAMITKDKDPVERAITTLKDFLLNCGVAKFLTLLPFAKHYLNSEWLNNTSSHILIVLEAISDIFSWLKMKKEEKQKNKMKYLLGSFYQKMDEQLKIDKKEEMCFGLCRFISKDCTGYGLLKRMELSAMNVDQAKQKIDEDFSAYVSTLKLPPGYVFPEEMKEQFAKGVTKALNIEEVMKIIEGLDEDYKYPLPIDSKHKMKNEDERRKEMKAFALSKLLRTELEEKQTSQDNSQSLNPSEKGIQIQASNETEAKVINVPENQEKDESQISKGNEPEETIVLDLDKNIQGGGDDSLKPSGTNIEPEPMVDDKEIQNMSKMLLATQKDKENPKSEMDDKKNENEEDHDLVSRMDNMQRENKEMKQALMSMKEKIENMEKEITTSLRKTNSEHFSFKEEQKNNNQFVKKEIDSIKETITQAREQTKTESCSYTDKKVQQLEKQLQEKQNTLIGKETIIKDLRAMLLKVQNYLKLPSFRSFSQAVFFRLQQFYGLPNTSSYEELTSLILSQVSKETERTEIQLVLSYCHNMIQCTNFFVHQKDKEVFDLVIGSKGQQFPRPEYLIPSDLKEFLAPLKTEEMKQILFSLTQRYHSNKNLDCSFLFNPPTKLLKEVFTRLTPEDRKLQVFIQSSNLLVLKEKS